MEAYVRAIVDHTSRFPNVFYEICNEGTLSGTWETIVPWHDWIVGILKDSLPINRLIFHNVLAFGEDLEYWKAREATLPNIQHVDGNINRTNVLDVGSMDNSGGSGATA